MGEVIGISQFAFMKGKQILDCVMIANEAVHSLKIKKTEGLLLKLDFEKAYDSIDWRFLEAVMKEMGFRRRWLQWISSCIRTVTMSVLVQGSPTRQFQMGRGLRQGDPLSPLLFNLVSEGLNVLMERGKEMGLFEGLEIGLKQSFALSHLQFADDTLLVCKGRLKDLQNLKRVLRCFQVSSGLKINLQKSMLYGINIVNQKVKEWGDIIGCSNGNLPFYYLGLPIGGNPDSISFWEPVISKFRDRLSSWKARFISRAGWATLVKAVLNNLPTYYMSLFEVTPGVVKELDKIRKRFLWSGGDRARNMSWVNWEQISKPKKLGGLGLGNLLFKNRALLMKWIWRFVNDNQPMWGKVVRSKYGCERGGIWPAKENQKKTSLVWRKVAAVLEPTHGMNKFLVEGFKIRIGNGKKASFWEDMWVPNVILKEMYPRMYALARNKEGKVSDNGVWEGEKWSWKIDMRRPVFDWEKEVYEDLIKTINTCPIIADRDDKVIWKFERSGMYNARSFVNTITSPGRYVNSPAVDV